MFLTIVSLIEKNKIVSSAAEILRVDMECKNI